MTAMKKRTKENKNVQHVVLGLFDDGADKTKTVGYPPRRGDLVGAPFRSSPVKGLAGIDEVVKGPHGLLHRGASIGAVGVDDVDVFEVEAGERLVHALDDVLPRQAGIVDGVLAKLATPIELSIGGESFALATYNANDGGRRPSAMTYLCRDDQVISVPAKVLDGLAHNDLGLSPSVSLSRIEEVDAAVVGSLHAGKGALYTG